MPTALSIFEVSTDSPYIKRIPALDALPIEAAELVMTGRCPCGGQVIVTADKSFGPTALRCTSCGASAQVTLQMAHEHHSMPELMGELITLYLDNAKQIQELGVDQDD